MHKGPWPWVPSMDLPATVWSFPPLLFDGPFHFCFIVLPSPVWWSSQSKLTISPTLVYWSSSALLTVFPTHIYWFYPVSSMILLTHPWQSSPLLPDSPPHSRHSIQLWSSSFPLSSRGPSTACTEPGGSFWRSLVLPLCVLLLSIFFPSNI